METSGIPGLELRDKILRVWYYEQYVSFSQFVTLLQIQARNLLDGGQSHMR